MIETRRGFIGKAALALISFATLSLTGCALTPANAKALINVLITSIQNILKVSTNAPWVGDLAAALTALQTAEASWSAGGTVAVIDDALNTLTAVLAVIPLTAIYSPLVDIVVAGIEAVLAVLPVATGSAKLRAAISSNPHHGRIVLNKKSLRHETPQGAYKSQWNGLCKQIGLPQAEM